MLQNPCKTLGFKKNMVYKIPPGGGGKPYPASGLLHNDCSHIEVVHPRRRSRAEFGLVLLYVGYSKLSITIGSDKEEIFERNGLDPDQDRSSVGPDLAPNCLQMLSADGKNGC